MYNKQPSFSAANKRMYFILEIIGIILYTANWIIHISTKYNKVSTLT